VAIVTEALAYYGQQSAVSIDFDDAFTPMRGTRVWTDNLESQDVRLVLARENGSQEVSVVVPAGQSFTRNLPTGAAARYALSRFQSTGRLLGFRFEVQYPYFGD
jgi:hypothetical protein